MSASTCGSIPLVGEGGVVPLRNDESIIFAPRRLRHASIEVALEPKDGGRRFSVEVAGAWYEDDLLDEINGAVMRAVRLLLQREQDAKLGPLETPGPDLPF